LSKQQLDTFKGTLAHGLVCVAVDALRSEKVKTLAA
jgi:hypothetical protein